jgi:hypothetical protein
MILARTILVEEKANGLLKAAFLKMTYAFANQSRKLTLR